MRILKAASIGLVLTLAWSTGSALAQDKVEENCKDRIDNDGDTVTDCADADCYESPDCKTAGGLENSNPLCSDFIDNDSDGAMDCEDVDCQSAAITVCKGSWEGPTEGTGRLPRGGGNSNQPTETIPELGPGMSVEDLIGTGGDVDGERNDFRCSDGYDNDGDGKIDCADFGCRFDPAVSVCRGTPGLRFGLAAHVNASHDFETKQWDTIVNRLQLRALGPIPFIQDSFFLISIRAERTTRLTFALFSFPLGGGHYLGINSGGGGLSNGLVLSVSKNILLDPSFYLYSAFEQGNGAAVEMRGPILPGVIDYRGFIAGGSGRFNGNIGGRFFNSDSPNYTWGAGAQLAFYLKGRFDRWDTRYLYTPVPLSATMYIGGRYDQREAERFPAFNANILLRANRFIASLEAYYKRELEFDSNQASVNLQIGVLLIPKWLFLAADIGGFRASDYENLPAQVPDGLPRINDETMWRVALHTYVWRNTGLVSLLYTDRNIEAAVQNAEDTITRELRVEAQIRF